LPTALFVVVDGLFKKVYSGNIVFFNLLCNYFVYQKRFIALAPEAK